MGLIQLAAVTAITSSVAAFPDAVASLPTFGAPAFPQYAGFADATADGKNKLHYWYAACESAAACPLLLWLNGGPGASSLTGLLAEKLGPQMITPNSTLVDNPDRITTQYHLLTMDNPVGSGYSSTSDANYVTSEYEVRTQFVYALRGFFKLHPELSKLPFWVTGESYAGHYVPNIAYEIAVNASEIPLQGVLIGNGMYNMKLQYTTLGDIAYAQGVIDEQTLGVMHSREAECLVALDSNPSTAGDFCENVTVRWLYSSAPGGAGELFYYDLGLADASFFDTLTLAMGAYLNRPDVVAAVHATVAEGGRPPPAQPWVQADEVGPVADALLPDWSVNSDVIVANLLELGLKVNMYNGVRDLSSCNHIGNLKVLLNLQWSGTKDFAAATNVAWPSSKDVQGHIRTAKNLRYATVLRTGHLVPTVVPEAFKTMLALMLAP